ncbi:MAG: hypothetical protein A3G32_04745 [Deltaproteobacteria bacterium RIFCSPLOWO2_12_FULL_40_28]|nr:MAG: hypothetical protein A3C45_08855 [Deltaproteobacteria bacterium RIFCSPHIGHO2_02_FULL_40_28]OGQ19678.1 MAG: hypothetical protein A3E27_08050 [Deltaproteobacteria bacterium RIFCSPHIGHO2_12_FULL_40_32]OGQ40955.1 MAG: hypothetical protein A3I69_03465 [Deltaproteobacteria bacterium RIFCSPLOWO2_02_FULL_40_36]OGQ54070.1 MAG: hypothetical protein A3G32_04745 [Deltaproteobacteria bacterium RIFCSPLOWO2_12_FULL_40_28]
MELKLIFKIKKWFQRTANDRGVALMIVLSGLMVLTVAVVEFSYNSRISYRIAVNSLERLQAYYLAKSAINFSKMLLRYNKEAQETAKKASSSIGSMNIEPIYRMMPLSSNLIRETLGGNTSVLGGEEGEEKEEQTIDFSLTDEQKDKAAAEEENEEETKKGITSGISMMNEKEAENFLDFEGDFSSVITEENSKFDLNRIFALVPGSKSADQRNQLLESILTLPQFKDLFEDQFNGPKQLVFAIGDWVDSNGMINEYDAVQRGNESSVYGKVDYPVKNAKFATLAELRLVAGMNDQIFKELAPFATIYTGSEKINACVSENDDFVKVLINYYTKYAGCASEVKYEDEEKMEELLNEIKSYCPTIEDMAKALNSKLGLTDLEEEASATDSSSSETTTTASSTSSSTSGATVPACAFQFKDLLTEDNKIFTIEAVGTVGDTETIITMVLNTDSTDPTKWKTYYYHVD